MSFFSNLFSNKSQKNETASEPQKPQYSATEYCEHGQKSLDAEKYVEAMEFFQAAIETDNHFEKAYLLLATAYERQGKNDKAKAALFGLLAIDPNNEETYKKVMKLSENNSGKNEVGPSMIAPSIQAGNLDGGNDPEEQKTNWIENYRMVEGGTGQLFDFFIVYDNGNRLYFKLLGDDNLEIVAPAGRDWEGYLRPKGDLCISERINYHGKDMTIVAVGHSAFSNCDITSIVLPNTIERLDSFSFYGCRFLTNVCLPNSIKSIGSYTFGYCESLKEITLPEKLEEIENWTFDNCSKLVKITIPKSVNKIDLGAFGRIDCELIMNGQPPLCFGYLPLLSKLTVVVPKGLKDAYMNAQYWQTFEIKESVMK